MRDKPHTFCNGCAFFHDVLDECPDVCGKRRTDKDGHDFYLHIPNASHVQACEHFVRHPNEFIGYR